MKELSRPTWCNGGVSRTRRPPRNLRWNLRVACQADGTSRAPCDGTTSRGCQRSVVKIEAWWWSSGLQELVVVIDCWRWSVVAGQVTDRHHRSGVAVGGAVLRRSPRRDRPHRSPHTPPGRCGSSRPAGCGGREQHLDQGTGGGLIPETASGGRSVVLMVDTERAGGAGSSQRRGARHGRAPGLMRSASR